MQHGLLVSGGGTVDRTIRFWNMLTGQPLHHVDTGSQVCNLAWSRSGTELVSTHGYSQNQILLWRYPSMSQIAKLTGHTTRVLYLVTYQLVYCSSRRQGRARPFDLSLNPGSWLAWINLPNSRFYKSSVTNSNTCYRQCHLMDRP